MYDDDLETYLMHYGMPRRSGRYPWGSGENPYQHGEGDFLSRVDELRKRGFEYTDPETGEVYTGDKAIYKQMGITSTQFRLEISKAVNERRSYLVNEVKSMEKQGIPRTEIARRLGLANESTVRSLLNEKSEARMKASEQTANFLKEQLETKGMIDVGRGVAETLGVSQGKLDTALKILKDEGYHVYSGRIPQVTNPGKQTTQKVLCLPDKQHKDIYDFENVHSLEDYTSDDSGKTFRTLQYPASLDSKRLKIILKDEDSINGFKGSDKDGLVEIRRGVKDLSLGNDRYSQVRILVDNDKYIKGMAVYSDNLPDGIDIVFNTSKTSYDKALKPITDDPNNPFGSLIKANGQSTYIDDNGNKQLSLINKTRGEGDWSDWTNATPSQFLGKQPKAMAKKQLDLAKIDKQDEFDAICKLENPTIKKHLLNKFADECDAAAIDLKAAALPGQKYHVIIPINTLKDDEVYAPRYDNGTKLALVRYPHGGTFEMPILKVNNKNKVARELLGPDVEDAVGININNAHILSGADFDGDTVMCIPTHDPKGRVKIQNRPPLEGLKDFDPTLSYGPETYKGRENQVKLITTDRQKQFQMGTVSNLIMDMTLAGATDDELAQAVRHSMVVIDAKKHGLNYKQSEVDNNIAALKEKYQEGGGAATLLTRAKNPQYVPKKQGQPRVNLKDKEWYDPTKPEGSLLYKVADDAYYTKTRVDKKTGEIVEVPAVRKVESTKMAETNDAYTLVSPKRHQIELIYADYANSMKDLANKARIEESKTGNLKYSPEAKKEYAQEVASLMSKTTQAVQNTPREREAQRRANVEVAKKQKNNPKMTSSELRKANQQAIERSRAEVGSVSRKKRNIEITDKEWEAIQKGAISEHKLKVILNNTDIDKLRERATPRQSTTPSATKIARIKAMQNSNFTIAQIAEATGLSPSTVSKYLKEGD